MGYSGLVHKPAATDADVSPVPRQAGSINSRGLEGCQPSQKLRGYTHREDQCATDDVFVRMLQPDLGAYYQSVQ